MKARMVSLVITMSLVLLTFGIASAHAGAGITSITAKWEFTDPGWVDAAGSPVCSGRPDWLPYQEDCATSIHDLADTYWLLSNSSDPRLDGIYVLRSTCNWPKGAFISGTCQGTWMADTDNDGQPDWEGVTTVAGVWHASGHGLGKYDGLNISFKVIGSFPSYSVEGQITGR